MGLLATVVYRGVDRDQGVVKESGFEWTTTCEADEDKQEASTAEMMDSSQASYPYLYPYPYP